MQVHLRGIKTVSVEITLITTRNVLIKGEPTWWLMFLPLLHYVGFEEAQNEEENHEPFFCVWRDTRRVLRQPSQKSGSTRVTEKRWRLLEDACQVLLCHQPTLVTSLQTQNCRVHRHNRSVSVVWKIGNLIVELKNWWGNCACVKYTLSE